MKGESSLLVFIKEGITCKQPSFNILFIMRYNHDLSNLLDAASDGWLPSENWEATKIAHKDMFNGMLHAVSTNQDRVDEPVKDGKILRSIWPFDIDE